MIRLKPSPQSIHHHKASLCPLSLLPLAPPCLLLSFLTSSHWVTFCHNLFICIFLSFRGHTYTPFYLMFSLSIIILRFIHMTASVVHYFSLLSCILLYGYATICVFIHLSMNIWIITVFTYKAAMNTHVQVFVWIYAFLSFR